MQALPPGLAPPGGRRGGRRGRIFSCFLTWDVHLVVDLAVAVDISPRG